MKLSKMLGILLALFSLLILYSLIRYGWFHRVTVVDETIPPMTVLAASHTGPYQNVGPVMGTLYEDLKKVGVSGSRGVGIYFDSPENTVPEKLRALVGQEISAKDLAKAGKLTQKYRPITLPAVPAKVVHFPYRGQLSIIFAVSKAYPELKKACGGKISTACIEVYDLGNREILFAVPQGITKDQQEQWLKPQTPAKIPADSVKKDSL